MGVSEFLNFKTGVLVILCIALFISSPVWIAVSFVVSFILTPLVIILTASFFINSRKTINTLLLMHHKFTVFKLKYLTSSKKQQSELEKQLINGELWNNFL